jgi:hypothetical protein
MARIFGVVLAVLISGAVAAQGSDRTLAVAPNSTAQPTDIRHALVIGNSAYAQGPLRNPVNDARAIAKVLTDTGFKVTLLQDASHPAMVRAIRLFGEHIAKGGVGLFYFAGHGLQVRGRNYLVPVNADIAHEEEIEFNAVDVNLVLAKMDAAKNGLNIVILDACRNNPFARSFRSMQTGLAQMDAPTGTFIAFATAPGSVAADGTGEHGVYTKYLLAEITKPGIPIEQLFKQVRNGVMRETANKQIPWESSSLRGDFAFRPGAYQASVADAVAEALKREREAQRVEVEKMLQAALQRQREQLAASGLRPPPSPAPAALDPAAIELSFWDSVKASSDASDFRAYLDQYPNGKFSVLARNRLAALEKAQPPVTPSKPTAVAAMTSALGLQTPASRRSHLPQQGDTWTYRLTEPRTSARNYQVKVAAASDTAVLDQFTVDQGPGGEWAHSSGGYVVALGKSLFSPYFLVFDRSENPRSLGRVHIADGACSGNYACNATARVLGRETVKVAAGTFEAIKVEVEHTWNAAFTSGHATSTLNGGRTLTIWYAPAVKRAVKFASRPIFGDAPPIDPHFDLELVSYKLN